MIFTWVPFTWYSGSLKIELVRLPRLSNKRLVEEKILTLHPKGKQGVNISKAKYETLRQAILSVVAEQKEITFKDLTTAVDRKLAGNFDGSISWYVTTIKLDLEARGLIVRVPHSSPQRLRLGS